MTDRSIDEKSAGAGAAAMTADGFSTVEPAWKAEFAADLAEEAEPTWKAGVPDGDERTGKADAADEDEPTGKADVVEDERPRQVPVESPADEPTALAAAGEQPATPVAKASEADVEEAMKDVVDPELGINVVDLGLVYGTHVDDDNVVTLDMTLTSAACPLTDVIEDQTRQALTTGPGGGLVKDFRINWVWLPPWGPDKITDEGREQLRALGFNV